MVNIRIKVWERGDEKTARRRAGENKGSPDVSLESLSKCELSRDFLKCVGEGIIEGTKSRLNLQK
jgi:hypothetical protein